MYIDFEKLPEDARIWVYLADKNLAESEMNAVGDYLKIGMQTWAAHGEPLIGGFTFLENLFLIIGVDQKAHLPSGCSIDASTRWIKEINAKFGIDFLTRAIVVNNTNSLEILPVFQIKQYVEKGLIQANSVIYDQQISTKSELPTGFLKPANELFGRYFLEKA
jgi:hypothetical protein